MYNFCQLTLLINVFCTLVLRALSSEGEAHWSSSDNYWNGFCSAGNRQSPIDLDIGKAIVMRWVPLQFHHYDVLGHVNTVKDGHIELVQGFQSWSEQPYITGGGLTGRYYLQQFHFHYGTGDNAGSEHTVGRLHYAMEIHFMHILEGYDAVTAQGVPRSIAVVAVFVQLAKKGEAIMDLEQAFDTTNMTGPDEGSMEYCPKAFLPRDTSTFFRYEGSLTTPPCTEGVIWTILAEPVYVTKQQLKFLHHYVSTDGNALLQNWREIQPLYGRPLYLNKLKVIVANMDYEDIATFVCFTIVLMIITIISIQYIQEIEQS